MIPTIEFYEADVRRFLKHRVLREQTFRLLRVARQAARNERRVQGMEQRSAAVIRRLEDCLAAQVA